MGTIILTAGISAVAAVGVYVLITNLVLKNSIRKRSEAAVKEAEAEGEMIKKEKILQAKEKFIQLKSEHDRQVNERNQRIAQSEQRAKQIENNLQNQQRDLENKLKEMKIKVKEMSLSHLQAEVANEKRLDSIGSGTGDRIREAELAFATARMELEQLKTQLANEKKAHAAAFRSKQLEGSISARNLEAMQRTLDDAQVKAPRKGTVTWLNKSLGTSIGAGEKLAVVSDLTHFKIEGEIPESNSGKLSVGSVVNVRINRNTVKGKISTISPQSQNGMVQFIVFLDDDSDKLLRSGLRTDLNVVYDVKDGVVRIPNGSYFQGPGTYVMFVKSGEDKLERRTVTLGDSNFDFVEVTSGIQPGEEVVVSDMSSYKNKRSIKLK